MQAINFSSMSLAELKEQAIALNAKIEGDRRLRATWIRACELAQAALSAAAKSVDEFTGYPIAQSVGSTVQAMGEAYEIAHAQFVVPTEKALAAVWNFATSEQAIRIYLNAAIALMRFCFAMYRSGMIAREWMDAFVEECLESEEDLQILTIIEARAIAQVKRFGAELYERIWDLDAEYQLLLERFQEKLMREVRSLFSIAEWISFLIS